MMIYMMWIPPIVARIHWTLFFPMFRGQCQEAKMVGTTSCQSMGRWAQRFKMVLPCTNTAQDAGIQRWTQKTRACSPISNHKRGWNPCSPGSQVLGYRGQVTSGYHSGRVHCRSGTRVSMVLWWSAASWCTIVLRLVTVDWWQIHLQLSLDICTWNW